jgi:chromosome segregation ATPase
VVEHTSARDHQYIQHLEQQLEQQQERIALLNQLQHETESHVAELRQENIHYSSDLAASTAASHATGAKLKELDQELNGMKEETGKLLKALATEEHLKEHALEQASLSNAAKEREVCACVTVDAHAQNTHTHTHTHTHKHTHTHTHRWSVYQRWSSACKT